MHDDIKKNRINYFDNMRAIAIMAVVAMHSLAYCQEFLGATAKEIAVIIGHTISVPVFLFVEGYLFARKNRTFEKLNYIEYIKKSGFRLLLPWLIFSIGYSILRYIFELNDFVTERIILDQPIGEVLKIIYGSVVSDQLYFLPTLFVIRLLAPITKQLLILDKQIVLFLSFFLIVIVYSTKGLITPFLEIPNGHEPILHAYWLIPYYLVGINFFLFENSLNSNYSFIACFLFLCIAYAIYKNFITFSFMVRLIQFSLLLSFCFASKIISFYNTFIGSIGRNTMGIYLLHMPILLKAISLIINNFFKQPLLSYILITFITFFSSYILSVTINRVPFGPILFGLPPKKNL